MVVDQGFGALVDSVLVRIQKWCRKCWIIRDTSLREMWSLNRDTWVWYVQRLIMMVVPAGPVDEFLVSFLKEIKEKLHRHILIKDPLQAKRNNKSTMHLKN